MSEDKQNYLIPHLNLSFFGSKKSANDVTGNDQKTRSSSEFRLFTKSKRRHQPNNEDSPLRLRTYVEPNPEINDYTSDEDNEVDIFVNDCVLLDSQNFDPMVSIDSLLTREETLADELE